MNNTEDEEKAASSRYGPGRIAPSRRGGQDTVPNDLTASLTLLKTSNTVTSLVM